MIILFASLVIALLLDRIFGEPNHFHPLVGFGNLANRLEKQLNRSDQNTARGSKATGLLALFLIVTPFVLLTAFISFYLSDDFISLLIFSSFVLYSAIGWQSLKQHIIPISDALSAGSIQEARYKVSMIVSRDTQDLNEQDIATAACESALENGADAIFAAIFWFLVAGIPGVVLYRLSNTLDAMWGYKNERFLHFGWAAARLDDLMNFIPARLTAYSYALVGNTTLALQSLRLQRRNWKSPNAGPVMAAGAGAINVQLGGAAIYHGKQQERPRLGLRNSPKASASSPTKAIQLIDRALILWCGILFTITVLIYYPF